MSAEKYTRKIPTTVTAIQFDGTPESYYACLDFIGRVKADRTDPESSLYVGTLLNGAYKKQEVQRTDWITRDEYGRFQVLGDGSFTYQFEKAEGE